MALNLRLWLSQEHRLFLNSKGSARSANLLRVRALAILRRGPSPSGRTKTHLHGESWSQILFDIIQGRQALVRMTLGRENARQFPPLRRLGGQTRSVVLVENLQIKRYLYKTHRKHPNPPQHLLLRGFQRNLIWCHPGRKQIRQLSHACLRGSFNR